MHEYRRNLRSVLGASAGPYGYTLPIWSTGAVLINAFELPSPLDASLFMLGAVLAFVFVGLLAFGGIGCHFDEKSGEDLIWGSFHILSVGSAIGLMTLVAHYLGGLIAWPSGSFPAATAYFLVLGVESSVACWWDHLKNSHDSHEAATNPYSMTPRGGVPSRKVWASAKRRCLTQTASARG